MRGEKFRPSAGELISYPDLPQLRETFQCKTEWDMGMRLLENIQSVCGEMNLNHSSVVFLEK